MIPKQLPILFAAGAEDPVGGFGKGVRKVYEKYKAAGIQDISLRPVSYTHLDVYKRQVTYYDGMVYVNLSEIKPMIAMPFHPSNVYTIDELNANLRCV